MTKTDCIKIFSGVYITQKHKNYNIYNKHKNYIKKNKNIGREANKCTNKSLTKINLVQKVDYKKYTITMAVISDRRSDRNLNSLGMYKNNIKLVKNHNIIYNILIS